MPTVEVSEDSNSGHWNAVSWCSGHGWYQADRPMMRLHVKGRCECGPDLREIAESHRRRLFTAFFTSGLCMIVIECDCVGTFRCFLSRFYLAKFSTLSACSL